MKLYFAVIDTNVLVSALLATFKGKDTAPLQILWHVLDSVIKPIYNEEILNEIRKCCAARNFIFPLNLLIRF